MILWRRQSRGKGKPPYARNSVNSDETSVMVKYRFYTIDKKQRVLRRPLLLECANDVTAIDEAMQRLNRHIIEVWQLTRRVVSLDPREKMQLNRIAR
jgi:hypothetical protein